jgi:hypothetical protein
LIKRESQVVKKLVQVNPLERSSLLQENKSRNKNFCSFQRAYVKSMVRTAKSIPVMTLGTPYMRRSRLP